MRVSRVKQPIIITNRDTINGIKKEKLIEKIRRNTIGRNKLKIIPRQGT